MRLGGYLAIAVVVIGLDQLTKKMAEYFLDLHQPWAVFPGLNFTLAYNKGAAFSMLANAGGWQTIFFTIIAVLAAILIISMLRNLNEDQLQQGLGLALILGGALGNLIDRLFYGQVTDFIDVYYGTWHFATFNVADIAISVGAALVIMDAVGWILPGMPKPEKIQTESSK